ncbi:hypothetical protein AVEN_183758-1 [Araneus ventricosus]|uniref:Uncharacterized protein n=1 Tax=Araneus ventricosus TaxID=182803 RepID=A0A4Y2MCK9_ARAVE|nr:hypothetical protein AVEN_183758-1 [Araneus ventricosus]
MYISAVDTIFAHKKRITSRTSKQDHVSKRLAISIALTRLRAYTTYPHNRSKGRLTYDVRFNVHEDHVYGESSVKSGYEHETLRLRSRDLATRPPRHRQGSKRPVDPCGLETLWAAWGVDGLKREEKNCD